MKRLFLFTFCLIVSFTLYSRRITEIEAMEKASEVMPLAKFKSPLKKSPKSNGTGGKSLESNNLYFFNASDKGFVIVSGDDRLPAILGFSPEGHLDMSNPPASLLWLLELYDRSIASLPAEDASSMKNLGQIPVRKDISPLIKTQWGQGAPYNSLCPRYNSIPTVTGCVATAMAQVINYHQWPVEAVKSVSGYPTPSNNIELPDLPEHSFDWNNMNSDAIAQLMLYCGQSIRTDFTPWASGASSDSVVESFTNIFKFSKGTSLVSRYQYLDNKWIEAIYSEIEKERPVLYFGQSPSEGGHAFVIDGYSNGLFHINWGWDGSCDGYFLMDSLDPDGRGGYDKYQQMVVNLYPPTNISDQTISRIILNTLDCSKRIVSRESQERPFLEFSVTCQMENDIVKDAELEIGLALYNSHGPVEILTKETKLFKPNEIIQYSAKVTIPSSVPEGNYRIVAVNRTVGSSEWLPDYASDINFIDVDISGTGLILQPMPQPLLKDEDLGCHIINGINYRLRINNGQPYRGLANVVQLPDGEPYKGDLYIPDFVEYQNMLFKVCTIDIDDEGTGFQNIQNPYLSSISTSVTKLPHIQNCPSLKTIDLREGVALTYSIEGCPELETIIFPSTCYRMGDVRDCDNLKNIYVLRKENFTFRGEPDSFLSCNTVLPSLKDVYLKTTVPPVIDYHLEEDEAKPINSDINIHIPKGSISEFLREGWEGWNLVEDQPTEPLIMTLDYCGTDERSNEALSIGMGDNNVEVAIKFTSDYLYVYKNCRITAIEYNTWPPLTNDITFQNAEYAFITTSGTNYLVKEASKTRRGQWTRVELSEPFPITEEQEDLYIGIGRAHALMIMFANREDIYNPGAYVRYMGTDPIVEEIGGEIGVWYDDIDRPVAIRAIIEGEQFPSDVSIISAEIVNSELENKSKSDALIPDDSDSAFSFDAEERILKYEPNKLRNISSSNKKKLDLRKVKASEGDKFRFKIRNRSSHTINNLKICGTIDGKEIDPIAAHTSLLPNHHGFVYADIPTDITGRNLDVNLYVSEVDGEPDEIPSNSRTELVLSTKLPSYFPRKMVMEEVTATWCPYSPAGHATIEYMKKNYPDNFIAITIHPDEEMHIIDNSYDEFYKYGGGAVPFARLNRVMPQDLSPFNIDDVIDKGEAMIQANASFTEEGEIEVKTETVFGFSDSREDKYRIAYVLMEDKLGPYYQRNIESMPDDLPDDPYHYLNADYLAWWRRQEDPVEIIFNNVARSIDDYKGNAGSLPDNIIEGEIYTATKTIPIPLNVVSTENLKIIALLMVTDGEIINADEVMISGTPPASPVRAESLTFDITDYSGNEGDTFKITPIILPENVTTTKLKWESTDDTIAVVDEEGCVTLLKSGWCQIIGQTIDSSYLYASCQILCSSGISEIYDESNDRWDVYDISGVLVKKGMSQEEKALLQPGIYIFRNGSNVHKVSIH